MAKIKLKTIVWIISGLTIVLAAFLFYKFRAPKAAEITFGDISSAKLAQEQTLPLYIDTIGKTINAAEVYLKFNPDQIEIVSVSKENSIFSLWITDSPTFSNQKGEIAFAGGLPTPGFSGKGKIGTIKIKPKQLGKATFEFDGRTRALLNDGKGTAINLKLDSLKIKVGG